MDNDVMKTCGLKHVAQFVAVTKREGSRAAAGYFGADIARQTLALSDEIGRSPRPDAERDTARGRQDAAHLTERLQPVREELQPLLAQHDLKCPVGEGEG